MEKTQYGIKNKNTGLLFAGFAADGAVIWAEKGQPMTYDQAKTQALLLYRFGVPAQQKPVSL